MATKKDYVSSHFAQNKHEEIYDDDADTDLDEEIGSEARRAIYKTKREMQRKAVEHGAESIFKKVQPFELHGSDQTLKANYAQVNFRVAPEKRDWSSTYMDELLNAIDKELLQEGFKKNGGRGKKSKGSDFVLNAFMDLFIVLQEDQEKLELPEGYHDWLESLRAYLKVRRKHMNFHK